MYLELKYFPLNSHFHSFTCARFAQCAAQQGKFWPFHDLMFDRQSEWKSFTSVNAVFRQMAQEVDLDLNKLDACLKDEKVEKVIWEDKEKGNALGVRQTPTYFINEEMVVGTKSLEDTLGTQLGPVSSSNTSHEPGAQ